MIVLVGLMLAAVLLFTWLIGHWFARVLAFLVLAVVLGGFGGLMTSQNNNNAGAIGGLIGIAVAWPLSGIPLYVRRRQTRDASLALALR